MLIDQWGAPISSKALTGPESDRGRLWHTVYESFAGAWQTNTEISIDTALAYHAVYSCVTLISNDISKLRPRLVEKVGNIWKETTNPAYSPVLRKPNHFQNRIQFFKHWLISKLSHGNTYVLKKRDNRGIVVDLYILDATKVDVLISDAGDGEVYYRLQRDNLAGLDLAGFDGGITVPASEIIHDRMNALYHPLVGISPIHASGLAAQQGLNIMKSSSGFFKNGARPGGILTAPGEIKKETAARLKETWTTNFSGDNAGKIAILGDGLKYESMMMKSTDAQLIEQLKYSAETVAATYHVPYYMIGGSAPAYNNISALSTQYYTQCLQVLIEELEACLDEGLGLEEKSNLGTDFDIDGLLRMDLPTKIESLVKGVGGGILAPNEAREKMDLGEVEGGATPYLQQQNFSLAALNKRDAGDDPFGKGPKPAPAPVAALPAPEQESQEEQIERALQAHMALQKHIHERMMA